MYSDIQYVINDTGGQKRRIFENVGVVIIPPMTVYICANKTTHNPPYNEFVYKTFDLDGTIKWTHDNIIMAIHNSMEKI